MPARGLSTAEFNDLAKQVLQDGHCLRFQASGRSMQPFIRDGDILILAPLSRRGVRRGDMVLVESGEGKLLVHRVVKTRRQEGNLTFLVQGDACTVPDGWFGIDKILGRVIGVERGDRKSISSFLLLQLRARVWLSIAPWATKLSWLPESTRRSLRRLLMGSE